MPTNLKRKSINAPQEVIDAITSLQKERNLSSWSQAAVALLIERLEAICTEENRTIDGWWSYDDHADAVNEWKDEREKAGLPNDLATYYLEKYVAWGGSRAAANSSQSETQPRPAAAGQTD